VRAPRDLLASERIPHSSGRGVDVTSKHEAVTCEQCAGTGWRTREVDGIRRAERCPCWRSRLSAGLLSEARIPDRYRACDFSTFVTYPNEQLLRAVERAREFAAAFPVVDRGLLLIGPPGIGKTHLAVSVLREVVTEKGGRGLYFDTRTLLSTIRSTYNPVTKASEADVLGRVMTADLLVLDDLGAERPTDWVEETMNLIVNTRYNDRKPTVFTTNYEDVPPGDELESLLVRVGFRMHSRLREMCEFLEYSGPDYRDFEYPPSGEDMFRRWKHQKQQRTPFRGRLPKRATSRARAKLKEHDGQLDLGWSGGKVSS